MSQRNPPFRLVFASGEEQVRQALGRLLDSLEPRPVCEEDRSKVELVLGEILNNVVEHAYGEDCAGPIRLTCRFNGRDLRFCVCDSGRALPGLSLPPGRLPDLDCDREDLPEGGFGWFLVRSLTSDLSYARRRGCNVLTFRVGLSGSVSPGG